MSKVEESIDGMEKFNEKIYEDGITWLFCHHCLECGHLTFAQHEVKELAKYFYELGHQQAEEDLELTWEDIPEILRISEQLKTSWWFRDNEQTKQIGTQVFWEEVLKRFKERKKNAKVNV